MLVVGVLLSVANVASATIDTFGTGSNQFTIDFVNISGDTNPTSGYGIVNNDYRMGTYEITNEQWNKFTNIYGTPTGSPSGAYDESAYFTGTNVPTNNVSWYEAAQFCNYLTSGNKSLGAYQLGTDGSINIDRNSAVSSYGIAYVIPTEDEWYKAAYYTGSGYSTYANGTDTAPIEDIDSNYDYESGAQPWNIGNGTQEQNGTFDMMGNVWEWNETLILSGSNSYRVYRGAAYDYDDFYLKSSGRTYVSPYYEASSIGFRVASVPEPATLLLLGLGGLVLRTCK